MAPFDRLKPSRRVPLLAAVCAGASLTLLTTALAASSADLSVDTTDEPDPVRTNQLLAYSTTVANAGPDAAQNVRLIERLPPRVDFVNLDFHQGNCTRSGRVVRCEIAELGSGASARLVVRIKPTKEGVLTSEASVTSPTPDPRDADNSDIERTTVQNPEPVICGGRRASIIGTDGDDAIDGTAGNDVIAALSGNDAILGHGGDDVVCGSGGNDAIKGLGGNDVLRGGGGEDALKGGNGADVIRGKGGPDALRGGRGRDILRGGGGSDSCAGGRGRDKFRSC